jgi:hypothetical protein
MHNGDNRAIVGLAARLVLATSMFIFGGRDKPPTGIFFNVLGDWALDARGAWDENGVCEKR